jgi:O-antigen polymerase
MTKTFTPMLLLCALAACLLNSNAFSAPSLIAFFLYGLIACMAMFFIFSRHLFTRGDTGYRLPANLLVFAALCAYVLLHGFLLHRLELTHIYWMLNAMLLLAVNAWLFRKLPEKRESLQRFLFRSIVILALLESLLVLLQCIRVMPVPSKYFWCTGSWSNPNVTAMFLALSVFAWQQLKGHLHRNVHLAVIAVMLLAIAALQCRSAYLATLVLLLWAYGAQWWAWLRKKLRFNLTGLAIVIVLAVFVQALFNVFTVKEASTTSRLQIWRNSAKLFTTQPFTGYGFGMFEQAYNLFAAQQENEVNDYVAMPYNDFVELSIEGGLLPVLLYITFLLLSAWRYPRLRSVLAAFAIIQLTNFGFQAIPALVLFLLYTGLLSTPRESSAPQPLFARIGYAGAGTVLALLLFVHVASLTGAFYKKWKLSKRPVEALSLHEIISLEKQLSHYPSFHEQWGDYYIAHQQPREAVVQYQAALNFCSQPDVLSKCGFAYLQLHMYDSTEYYYTLVSHMQPHKFVPRMDLLNLYQLRNDTAMVLATATNIMQMPVKVRSKKVAEIRWYAQGLLKAREQYIKSLSDYSRF